MRCQESLWQLKESPDLTGGKLDQLLLSDVWKNGPMEFTLSDFSSTESPDGSNSNKPQDTSLKMMKLKVSN